ncbi:MAG: hypothetical protein PVF17_00585 [Ignavibacteria bacterium]
MYMIDLNDLDQFPEMTAYSLRNYLNFGTKPGSFLTALLANDLKNAVTKADDENILLIREYVRWLIFNAPDESWGTYDKVNAWIKEEPNHE